MHPRLVRPLLAALGLWLLGTAATAGLPAVQLPRLGAERAAASVPDALLAIGHPPGVPYRPAAAQVFVLQPPDGKARPILEGAEEPLVAPDGRDLFFLQRREVGEELRTTVVALAAEAFEPRWSADVGARPAAADRADPLAVQLAATRDRLYAATHTGQSTDPIAVFALDRADGRERERWTVDTAGRAVNSFQLVAAPDGRRLDLLAAAPAPPGRAGQPPGELLLHRFRLPDAQEEGRHAPSAEPGAADLAWSGRPTADGRALYRVTWNQLWTRVVVEFLDLASGALQRLELPFRQGAFLAHEQALSHDGQRLYVLAPTLGELAVVDLAERRLEQVVLVGAGVGAGAEPPLLTRALGALRDFAISPALAKSPHAGAMQLSPDGRRLYATGFVGQGENARADGIWAIDTATWRIVGRWLPGVPPIGFYLGDDGRRLYVQPLSWAPGAVPELRILDAATGAELDRVDLIPGRLVSLAQRYRETYGRSPDTRPGAAPRVLPMAAMAVAANPGTIVGGDAAAVELRFVAPGTDRPVGPGQPDVRYDPPARAWAALVQRHGTGDDDRTVGLAPAGRGVYRGTVALPSPTSWGDGSWSVRAVAEWPDGVRRRATLEDAVVVQRAFAGTDGRRYILEVATNPAPPVVDRPAAVRLAFVDAETRAPLPAGVSIAEDLPRDAEVAFFGAGVNSEDLRRVGHGVYEGEVQLWAPGPWRVWAALRRTGKPDQSHLVGSVRAVKGD